MSSASSWSSGRSAAASAVRSPRRTMRRVFVDGWHVWLVVVLAGGLAVPRLTYLLPAVEDHADEIYQPLQALKFAASKGQAFHKYGPAPNFILLPVFAPSMLYWKATGEFSKPQNDFPFGLARPLDQIGLMIFEGRLVFLLLGLAGLGLLTLSLTRVTRSRLAASAAVLLVAATNYRVQWALPTALPDAAMVAFVLMAMAAFAWMLVDGVRPWRAAGFAVAAAMAAGSKENSMPLLLAMALTLIAATWLDAWRDGRPGAAGFAGRSTASLIGVGVGLYALMNVVYAPKVWWARMQYWTVGPGVSGDVWGTDGSTRQHVVAIGRALLDNFGPAGVIVVAAAVAVAFVSRPKLAAVLAIPAAVAFAVLWKVPYVVDRFATPTCVLMTPLVALGIAAVLAKSPRPTALAATALLVVAVAVNAWWSTVTYHLAAVREQAMIERDAPNVPPDRVIAYGTMASDEGGLYRLRRAGHRIDARALQDAISAGEFPDVVYVGAGRHKFLEQARDMPERAANLMRDKQFDVHAWPGLPALGYAERRVDAAWPGWLRPFKWMPLNDEKGLEAMLVFERPADAATGELSPATRAR